jgi:hypothetical protein
VRTLFKYILVTSFILSGFACQELVELPLEEEQTRVVIEGLISNKEGRQSVSVARTLNYYETGQLPPITDANVNILDSADNLIEQFVYNAEDSTYKSLSDWTAEVGKSYKVQVEVDDQFYEASGKIIANARLDSVYYLSDEQLEALGQNSFGDGFFIFVDGSLPSTEIQYFLLETTVNDTLRNDRGDLSNSILSSEFFGSEFQFLPVPGLVKAQDSVRLELFTLTEDVYQYYIEFVNLLFNDGGVFSPPPVNPKSNISNTTNADNYALGFIQFSSVIENDLYIDEEE